MAFEMREGNGSLFKAEKKQPTHADYEGRCLLSGVEYYMSAWIKEGAKGKYMSFAFKPVQAAKPVISKPRMGDIWGTACYVDTNEGPRKPAADFKDSDLPDF